MLLPLTRAKITWAAYCDGCLVGSLVIRYDDPAIARAWAIEKLRAMGWSHVAPRDIPTSGRADAERAWTGETYCFECASARARAERVTA